MGAMIAYHGYNDPMYNAHEMCGCALYTATYGKWSLFQFDSVALNFHSVDLPNNLL